MKQKKACCRRTKNDELETFAISSVKYNNNEKKNKEN